MAIHVASVRTSTIEQVTKSDFYQRARTGDLLFLSGHYAISMAIEYETSSPWSHVLTLWLPRDSSTWLTIESTIRNGVHIGRLADYVDYYDGDLVLTRRPTIDQAGITAIRERLFTVLDDRYDWRSELGQAAHRLIEALPVITPKNEYYCSGLQYFGSLAVPPGLQRSDPCAMPSPEDLWCDPSVVPVCALKR